MSYSDVLPLNSFLIDNEAWPIFRVLHANSDIAHPSICGGVPDTMTCSDVQCYCLDAKQIVVTAGKTVRQRLLKFRSRDFSEI